MNVERALQAERGEHAERVHELQEELLALQREAHAAERRAELAERQTAEAHRLILDMQVRRPARCPGNSSLEIWSSEPMA